MNVNYTHINENQFMSTNYRYIVPALLPSLQFNAASVYQKYGYGSSTFIIVFVIIEGVYQRMSMYIVQACTNTLYNVIESLD
jgi:hypothetical protein